MPYPRNREGAKTDYEPRFQRETEKHFQNREPVKRLEIRRNWVGPRRARPFRHTDEKYTPKQGAR